MLATIAKTCVAAFLSMLFGFIFGKFVHHNPWFGDPIGVVGLPIVDGYSERSEQIAWLLFWCTSIVVPFGAMAVLDRCSEKTQNVLAAIAIVLSPCLFVAHDAFASEAVLLLLAGGVAFVVGAGVKFIGQARPDAIKSVSFLVWIVTLGLLVFRRYSHFLAMFKFPQIALGSLLVVALAVYLLSRFGVNHRSAVALWQSLTRRVWIEALMASVALLLFPSRIQALLPCVVTAAMLGMIESGRVPTLKSPRASYKYALMVAMAFFTAWANWHHIFILETDFPLVVLFSTGVGVTLRMHWNRWTISLPDQAIHFKAFGAITLAVAVFPFFLDRWWSALIVGGILLPIVWQRRYRYPSVGMIIVVAVLLMFVFLPRVSIAASVDPFHQGQILSAVWEFEQGRSLFTEVFPLNSYNFFVCWIGRHFLPATLDGYVASTVLLGSLTLVGGFLIGIAWTRSMIWGLATGMLMASQGFDGRTGLGLIVAGVVLAAMRWNFIGRFVLLALCGLVSGFAGFDVAGPIGLSTAGAVFFAFPGPLNRGLGELVRNSFRRLCDSFKYAAILVIPFCVVLAVGGHWQSVLAFGVLFLDNARNLNAHYGLPLSIADIVGHPSILPLLGLLTLWNAAGVCAGPNRTFAENRSWWFVSLFVLFLAQRGIGRSDLAHLKCCNYALIVLAAIATFETVSAIRRLGLRSGFTDRRNVATVILLYALWMIPQGTSTPWSLYRDLAELPETESSLLVVDRFVTDSVGPNESYWPIENGLATYVHQRRNPTRHAIAYVIPSPQEQARVVRKFRNDPPKLIEWPTESVDGIAVSLRYYVISQFVFRNYHPAIQPGYLVPVPVGWKGNRESVDGYSFPVQCGKLAYTWGKMRMPFIDGKECKLSQLRLSVPNAAQDADRVEWRFNQAIPSGRYNYLLAQFKTPSKTDVIYDPWPIVSIQFGTGDDGLHEEDLISFKIDPQGDRQQCLIPIGCCPGWTWRSDINRLVVSCEASNIDLVELDLIEIDEMQAVKFLP